MHSADGTLRCQHATLDAGAYEVCSTGVEAVNEVDRLVLFPNPAIDRVRISFGTDVRPSFIEILDAQGRMLRNWPVMSKESIEIDVRALPEGVYLVRAINVDGAIVRSFVKL